MAGRPGRRRLLLLVDTACTNTCIRPEVASPLPGGGGAGAGSRGGGGGGIGAGGTVGFQTSTLSGVVWGDDSLATAGSKSSSDGNGGSGAGSGSGGGGGALVGAPVSLALPGRFPVVVQDLGPLPRCLDGILGLDLLSAA